MGHFHLQSGLVIQRQGQVLELVSRTLGKLHFEAPTTGERETLTDALFWSELYTQQLTILEAVSSPETLTYEEAPPEEQPKYLGDLTDSQQQSAERRLKYVDHMKRAGLSRGQTKLIRIEAEKLAAEIKDELGCPSSTSIQRWWRALDKKPGDVFVVVSNNAFAKRFKRLDPDSDHFLAEKIAELYLQPTRPTGMGAYMGYLKALRLENLEREIAKLPALEEASYRTFMRRVDGLPKYDVMVARLGREAARHYFHMAKGTLPSRYPLDVVEIDHTPMNLYVIDNQSYLPLGRPWLTAIKDRHTSIILGFYVSFRKTGLDSIFGAIKHSLHSHHYVSSLSGIENPWPAFGLGAEYASDRGLDFMSPRYRTAIMSLGARYSYCQVRTPWLKGSVERFFRTLEQTFFDAMPGRTFSTLAERRDYDPQQDAVIRFSTLIYLLHKWCVDFHNVTPNLRKQATPLQLWNEGIAIAPPIYAGNMDQLNIVLGEHHNALLSHEGLRFEWLQYADEGLENLMAQIGKHVKLDFVVTPDNLGHIQVKHPRTGAYFPVRCTRPDYAEGLTVYQHRYIRAVARETMKATPTLDMLVNTRAQIQTLINEELNLKNNSMSARIANINSNRELSGGQQSILDPFAGQTVDVAPESVVVPAPFTDIKTYAWG